ncbi:transposase [Rhizobium rosettiformans]|uniref:Transposase n=1 Tax=Rhizobium rosettiformans TaxID=1368430 RepID=A0ABX7F1D8_9HYPH|nr:transposase domain-containing protein [Rhizobium rosettiformans]QRF53545.1 transposase [Rhizobium rosettiformans]
MREWFTVPELAELMLPDMPKTERGIHDMAIRQNWRGGSLCRKRERRGGGLEFHMSLLPHRAQVKLAAITSVDTAREESRERRKALYWTHWDAMTDDQRQICHARLHVIRTVDEAFALNRAIGRVETVEETLARELEPFGVSFSTYYDWRKALHDVDSEDWLPALAPKYFATGEVRGPKADIHPDAWAALKSDFLRPEKPGFSACYRRVEAAAKKHGWGRLPSERALRRRMDSEVDKVVQAYAREGAKKAEALYPPQVRTKDHLHAMELVNTDGHQIDLFVKVPWKPLKPVRLILLGIQDIFSGKILSWRLSEAETWDVVRACIGDMIEDFGIPKHFYMDNGRAFASQAISGGAKHRNRFRKAKVNRFSIDEEEVGGILKNFGVDPHFTRPYAGQSKPIERAWKDLAEEISKHPAMSGAYTGNKPDAKPENYRKRAIPLDVLQAHVAERIAEHNARTGRKSDTAKGRSFDQTFEESMAHPATIVTRATAAQRDFWLLAEKIVQVRKNRGEVHYLNNIYWSADLTAWCGKKVKIRFDPDKLHEPVKVYAPNGKLICEAACTQKGRFNDVEAANIHNRNRKAFLKLQKARADLHRVLSADQLADVYSAGEPAEPKQKKPVRSAVTRAFTGNLAVKAQSDVFSDDEFEAGLADALSSLSGDGSIIPFPTGNRPGGIASGRNRRTEK